MKRLLYRVASSRSFTRRLSIVAVAVVAFAALALLAVPQALAGIACCTNSGQTDCICDPSLQCNITRNGKFYGFKVPAKTCWNTSISGDISTIKSELSCMSVSEDTFLDSAFFDDSESPITTESLTRTGLQECTVSGSADEDEDGQGDHDGKGFCQLELTYSRPLPAGLTQCSSDNGDGTSTLTYEAFCQDVVSGGGCEYEYYGECENDNPLTVTGTLKCGADLNAGVLPNFCRDSEGQPQADCTLMLGIPPNLGNTLCTQLFPGDAENENDDGRVLSFSQTVEGLGCPTDSIAKKFTALETFYCNGGTFDGAPVTCFDNGEQLTKTAGVAEAAVQFDVNFHPTINVKCNEKKQGKVPFTIFGNQNLDVTEIDLSSLKFAGTTPPPDGLKCNKPKDMNGDTFPDLTCHVNSCPDLGPALLEIRDDATKMVVIPVTGSLIAIPPSPEGTAIFGEDPEVKTSP